MFYSIIHQFQVVCKHFKQFLYFKMAKVFLYITLCGFAGLVSAASAEPAYYPSYVYPVEHRSLRSLQEESSNPADYEFQIVPSDQYEVAEQDVSQYDTPTISLTVWDLLPTPITAVATAISTAVSGGKAVAFAIVGIISKVLIVVKVIITKVLWIALGAGLVIGFCAFTPFCTLTIEKPFTRELRSMGQNVPYLDEIESLFYKAYDKVNEMYRQN